MHRSISVIGWTTILVSIIIITSNFLSLLSNPMDQFNILFGAFPQARNGLDSMLDLFQYSHIWLVYLILYFTFVLFGAIQFIRFHALGRTILEIACWIGTVNACIDSVLSYAIMKKLQILMSSVMGSMGMGIGNLNPLGTITIIAGFFFWIIPSIIMIIYLRNPTLRALMK